MNKRKIEKRLPEPQHSKEQKADGNSVRPAIAKPNVVRSPNVLSAQSKLENKIKVYDWFFGQLESLVKSTKLAFDGSDSATTYVGTVKLDSIPNTNTKKGKGIRRAS